MMMMMVRRAGVCVCGKMLVVVFIVWFVARVRGEGFDSIGQR